MRIYLVVCNLACLVLGAPVALANASYDGVYTGKRWVTNGPADICPTEDNVSVTIHGDTLTFTNSAVKNYAINFDFALKPDGTFDETHVDVGGNLVEIQGRIAGGVLEGDVNNPPCEHHWRLEKK
jgi:hypothetical protein